MQSFKENQFTRTFISSHNFALSFELVDELQIGDEKKIDGFYTDAYALFKECIEATKKAKNDLLVENNEFSKDFIKAKKKIKILCFKELPVHCFFLSMKKGDFTPDAILSKIRVLIFLSTVDDDEIVRKYSKKGKSKKAVEINNNNVTRAMKAERSESIEIVEGSSACRVRTRSGSVNPLKVNAAKEDSASPVTRSRYRAVAALVGNDNKKLATVKAVDEDWNDESVSMRTRKKSSTPRELPVAEVFNEARNKTHEPKRESKTKNTSVDKRAELKRESESDNELQNSNNGFRLMKKQKKIKTAEAGAVEAAKPGVQTAVLKTKATKGLPASVAKTARFVAEDESSFDSQSSTTMTTTTVVEEEEEISQFKKLTGYVEKLRENMKVLKEKDESKKKRAEKEEEESRCRREEANVDIRISDTEDEEVIDDEEDDKNDDGVLYVKSKAKTKKVFNYTMMDFNSVMEDKISKIKDLSELTPEQINYMTLRDVNYYVNIFAGQCEHSWRHIEFKKQSAKSSKNLYGNAGICSYRDEQYMSAIAALQKILGETNPQYDDYIIKVLLPEALIKICMRIYQCSKEDAEDYLHKNDYKCPIDFKDKDLTMIDDG